MSNVIHDTLTEEVLGSFLARTGLNMQVSKLPSPNVLTGELNSGFYDIYNGTTRAKIHSGVGEGYKVIQFSEAFDSIRQISGMRNVRLVDGGTWNGGAEGWGQIDLGHFKVGGVNRMGKSDYITNRLTMVTSHNGRIMFDLMYTPFRGWCENQLPGISTLEGVRRARETQTILKTRHSGKGLIEIENLPEVLSIIDGQVERTAEVYNKMSSIKIVDRDYIAEVLSRIFTIKPNSERSKNSAEKQIKKVMENYNSADDGRLDNKNTVWNLFNSIQGGYQHDPIRRTTTHDRSVLIGTVAEKSATAMQVCMDVFSSEHVNVLDDADPIAQMLKNIEETGSVGE